MNNPTNLRSADKTENGRSIVSELETTRSTGAGKNSSRHSLENHRSLFMVALLATPLLLAVSECDQDGDGFTIFQGDCNDADNEVYPGASELCHNGVDDNCNGAVDGTTVTTGEPEPSDGCFGEVYYSSGSQGSGWSLYRSDLDGGGPEDLGTVDMDSPSMDLDLENGEIYWSQWWHSPGLWVSDMNGSDFQPLTGCGHPEDGGGAIAVDPKAGYVFYGYYYGSLYRARVDGGQCWEEVELVTPSEAGTRFGMASVEVDPENRQVYFSTTCSSCIAGMSIFRVNYDGTDLVPIVPNAGDWGGFALDLEHGKIYWHSTEDGGNADCVRRRANLDGSDEEVLLTNPAAQCLASLAIDPAAEKVYFMQTEMAVYTPCLLMRSNFDGSAAEMLAELSYCGDVELDLTLPSPEP